MSAANPLPSPARPEDDGLALADLVRRGEVTPLELVDDAIAKVERVNPRLNAVALRTYDQARAIAAKPGQIPDGPFKGVPFVVKDLTSPVAGFPMTRGSRFFAGEVPNHDGELVRRYRAAGLIMIAKTTTPELGLAAVSEAELFGPTSTPWRPGRASGGSSGGSAALVGAGAVTIGHGGDGGGSLRIPASCCGVFGFKPSRGRVPTGPDVGEHWLGMAVEHVITRTVRDSAAVLDATCAPDLGAPVASPPRERPYLDECTRAPGKLRIGFTTAPFLPSTVHPDCAAAVTDVAALLVDLGHVVTEAAPEVDKEQLSKDFLTVIAGTVSAEISRREAQLGRRRRAGEVEPATALLQVFGRTISAADLCLARERLNLVGRELARFFARHDVLLTPTLAAPPPEHLALQPKGGEALLVKALARAGSGSLLKAARIVDGLAAKVYDFIPFTPLANVTGTPSMSVPLHWNADGLPIGVTFTGRLGDEATLFRLAAQLEEARPWRSRKPEVWSGA